MNAITMLRHTETIGAREFRRNLDKLLRAPFACRVMLHNKPSLAVLPDQDYLAILEILQELKTSGLLKKTQKQLQKDSKQKHAWYWSKSWQAKERAADKAIKSGRIHKSASVDDFLKELRA